MSRREREGRHALTELLGAIRQFSNMPEDEPANNVWAQIEAIVISVEDRDIEEWPYQRDLLAMREPTWQDLQVLDFRYDGGYGGQELFGTVWLKDGTWMERGEYDGSEWWEHRTRPEIPNFDGDEPEEEKEDEQQILRAVFGSKELRVTRSRRRPR